MLKYNRHFVSTLLAVIMLVMLFVPASVEAHDSVSLEAMSEQVLSPSKDALYSVTGQRVTGQLEQILKKFEVNVNDRTLIEVLPAEEGNNANIITVTNVENNLVAKDMLLNMGESGELEQMVNMNEDCASPMAGGTITYDKHDIVIKATAVFNIYKADGIFPHIRPIGSYFILYNEKKLDVSYIQTIYTSGGYTFSYPEFEDLNYFDSWQIHVTQNKPNSNTIYSHNREYSNYKVMLVTGGNPNAGQTMEIYVTIKGVTYYYTKSIPFPDSY